MNNNNSRSTFSSLSGAGAALKIFFPRPSTEIRTQGDRVAELSYPFHRFRLVDGDLRRSRALFSRDSRCGGGSGEGVKAVGGAAIPLEATRAGCFDARYFDSLSICAPRGGCVGIRNTLTAGMHYRCSRLRLEEGGGRAAPGRNSPLVKAIAFTFHGCVLYKSDARAGLGRATAPSTTYAFVHLTIFAELGNCAELESSRQLGCSSRRSERIRQFSNM